MYLHVQHFFMLAARGQIKHILHTHPKVQFLRPDRTFPFGATDQSDTFCLCIQSTDRFSFQTLLLLCLSVKSRTKQQEQHMGLGRDSRQRPSEEGVQGLLPASSILLQPLDGGSHGYVSASNFGDSGPTPLVILCTLVAVCGSFVTGCAVSTAPTWRQSSPQVLHNVMNNLVYASSGLDV